MAEEKYLSKSTVIILLDIDCFEWQVEVSRREGLRGHPGVVINPPSKIVAVRYEARNFGVTRDMSINEATQACPVLQIVMKNMKYGKPDSTLMRSQSYEIQAAIIDLASKMKGVIVECASQDECYLDITAEVTKRIGLEHMLENQIMNIPGEVYLEGREQKYNHSQIMHRITKIHPLHSPQTYSDEARLLHGGAIASEFIKTIWCNTGFDCSAGVSHNKLLAKAARGLNKPQCITVLPLTGLFRTSKKIKLENIPGLGGDGLGGKIKEKFGAKTMYDLSEIGMKDMVKAFNYETCTKLQLWGLGQCIDSVIQQTATETLTCAKKFHEGNQIKRSKQVYDWLGENFLGGELTERLEEELQWRGRVPSELRIKIGNNEVNSMEYEEFVLADYCDIPSVIQTHVFEQWGYRFNFPIGEIKLFVPSFVPYMCFSCYSNV